MFKCSHAWQGLAAGVLAALVLALALGPIALPAGAQPAVGPAGLPIYGTSPLVIPAAAFSSDGFDPDSMFFSFWEGYLRGGNINTCVKAPVYLPKGAKMIDMWTSVYDNDAAASMWVRLYRVDNFTGVVDEMAYVGTSGAADYIQTPWDWIDYALVTYPQYSYYVGSCMESSDNRLYSVRIYYNLYRTYLPVIFKQFGMVQVVAGDSLPDDSANQDVYSFSGTAGTHLDILVDTVSLATAFDSEACLSTEDSSASCFAFGDDQMTCTYPPPTFACPRFPAVLPADGDGVYYLLIESGSGAGGYAGPVGRYKARVWAGGYISPLQLIHDNQPGSFKGK
jgi:hypothetical protein